MDTRTFDKGGPLYARLRPLMGDGVVTCLQDTHRRQRRLLQPDFRPSRVADHADTMVREAESACRGWRAGDQVDVSAAALDLTTRVMNRLLFSDSLGSAAAAEVGDRLADIVRGLFVRTAVPVDVLFRLPTPANRRYRTAVRRVHAIVDEVVADRLRAGPADDRDDLLATLLTAMRDDTSGVTEQEVHDQLVTLLLAGAESTALCVASALDLLARHPEAERRLHAEVDSVVADRPRPDPDDLPYTRSVVAETLRHRPPGWLFTRITTQETTLAGQRLPRGTTVLYSPYLLHHDPASFPDPERFLPERWLPGGADAVPHGAMLPFAAGKRKCLGDTFAVAEVTLTLATIARRWRLRHLPGYVERLRPAATLGPRSLTMTCEPRAHAPAGTASGARSLALRATTAARAQDLRTAGDNGVDHT